MKKKTVMALLVVTTTAALLGGCRNKEQTPESTFDTYATESENDSDDDYYDEGETEESAGTESTSSESDLPDSAVNEEVKKADKKYTIGDTMPVMFKVDDRTYNATATVEALVTGEQALATVENYNVANNNKINALEDDLEYGVLSYRLALVDSDVDTPVNTELDCKVVSADGSDLVIDGTVFKAGSSFYTIANELTSGAEAYNTVIFCVPKACDSFGIKLGSGSAIIVK